MSGAITIPLQAGDRTLRLVFKFGTMRIAERELGEPITSVFSSGGEKVGFDAVSAVFFAALQPSHAMTRDASDDLIDTVGIEKVMAAIVEGVIGYFGGEEGEGNVAPPSTKKAQTKKGKSPAS